LTYKLESSDSSLIVTIDRIADSTRYPLRGQGVAVEQSLSNQPILSGPSSGVIKFMWEVSCFLGQPQEDVFWALYRQQTLTAVAGGDAFIYVTDLVRPMVDTTTRTRALADAPNNAVTTISTNFVRYWAKFKVLITEPKSFELSAQERRRLTFILVES
jgi:hypothetical protein